MTQRPDSQPRSNELEVAIVGHDALLACHPARPVQVAHALHACGFDLVVPVSWGEELIADHVLKSQGRERIVFVASCPESRRLIQQTDAVRADQVVSTVAPAVATARYVRALLGERRLRITYVGRCDGARHLEIDAHLSPTTFVDELKTRHLQASALPDYYDNVIPPDRRRFYSRPGGLPSAEAAQRARPRRRVVSWSEGLRLLAHSDAAEGDGTPERYLVDVSVLGTCGCSGTTAVRGGQRDWLNRLEPPASNGPVVDATLGVTVGLPFAKTTLRKVADVQPVVDRLIGSAPWETPRLEPLPGRALSNGHTVLPASAGAGRGGHPANGHSTRRDDRPAVTPNGAHTAASASPAAVAEPRAPAAATVVAPERPHLAPPPSAPVVAVARPEDVAAVAVAAPPRPSEAVRTPDRPSGYSSRAVVSWPAGAPYEAPAILVRGTAAEVARVLVTRAFQALKRGTARAYRTPVLTRLRAERLTPVNGAPAREGPAPVPVLAAAPIPPPSAAAPVTNSIGSADGGQPLHHAATSNVAIEAASGGADTTAGVGAAPVRRWWRSVPSVRSALRVRPRTDRVPVGTELAASATPVADAPNVAELPPAAPAAPPIATPAQEVVIAPAVEVTTVVPGAGADVVELAEVEVADLNAAHADPVDAAPGAEGTLVAPPASVVRDRQVPVPVAGDVSGDDDVFVVEVPPVPAQRWRPSRRGADVVTYPADAARAAHSGGEPRDQALGHRGAAAAPGQASLFDVEVPSEPVPSYGFDPDREDTLEVPPIPDPVRRAPAAWQRKPPPMPPNIEIRRRVTPGATESHRRRSIATGEPLEDQGATTSLGPFAVIVVLLIVVALIWTRVLGTPEFLQTDTSPASAIDKMYPHRDPIVPVDTIPYNPRQRR